MMSRDSFALEPPQIKVASAEVATQPAWRLWTGDDNNQIQVLKQEPDFNKQ